MKTNLLSDERGQATVRARLPHTMAVFAIYFCAAAAIYGRSIGSFLLSDDFFLLQKVIGKGFMHPSWLSFPAEFFRPLGALSIWTESLLSGTSPLGFRAASIVLHAVAALQARRLAAAIDPSLGEGWKFIAGMLFLAWQSHAEAVCWVSSRFDQLCAIFYLAALASYIRHIRSGGATSLSACAIMFALALLAKEMALSFPFVALAAGLTFRNRQSSRLLRDGLLFATLTAAYLLLRWLAIGSMVGGYGAERHLAILPAFANGAKLLLRSFYPANPFLWYSQNGMTKATLSAAFYGSLACVLLLLFVFVSRPTRSWGAGAVVSKGVVFAAAGFILSLLPVVPLGVSLIDTSSERFLYLPTALLTAGITLYLSERPVGRVAVALVVLLTANAAVALMNASTWRSAAFLVERIVATMPKPAANETIYLLNTPDHLRGAYMLRNGLPEALELYRPDIDPGSVRTVAWTGMRSTDLSITVGADAGAFNVSCGEGGIFLFWAEDGERAFTNNHLSVEPLSPTSYRLTLRGDSAVGMRFGLITPERVRIIDSP